LPIGLRVLRQRGVCRVL